MACTLCEKLKNKTKSINNNIMADQNDMVTITNGNQTRKVARSYYETYCTKTWRIVEEPTEPEPTEPETTEPEPTESKPEEITGPDLDSEPKTKKKKP